jgi:hypothetical protein
MYGPRKYDRSLHTRHCIQRVKPYRSKRTRFRPIQIRPLGPLEWSQQAEAPQVVCKSKLRHKKPLPQRASRTSPEVRRRIVRNVPTSPINTVLDHQFIKLKPVSRSSTCSDFNYDPQTVTVLPDPQSILGQGALDHLSTYLIQSTDYDHAIIRHCEMVFLVLDY